MSRYDELAERGQFEGIMEIEEEGKEDMSQMVSAYVCVCVHALHGMVWRSRRRG